MGKRTPINGVFAGGGIKGIALGGAASAAMEAGYVFCHVVGTSSGALVASLIAAGYEGEELKRAVKNVPWPKLFRRLPWSRVPLVGKALAIATARAQYDATRLEVTWQRLLAARGVSTFADLGSSRLRIVATDLTHQVGVVLPDQLPEYGIKPDSFSVARAVAMSSAVPFYVPPVQVVDRRTGDVSLFIDGALTSNFPLIVGQWSPVRPIVGFRFEEEKTRAALKFRGPASLARGVVTAAIVAADTLHAPAHDLLPVVKVPLSDDPLDFDVSQARAAAMFEIGRLAGHKLFSGERLVAAEAPA